MKKFDSYKSLFVMISVFVCSGCAPTDDDIHEFNRAVTSTSNRVVAQDAAIYDQLSEWTGGAEINLSELYSSIQTLRSGVNGAIDRINSIEIPGDELCEKYSSSVIDLLRDIGKLSDVYEEIFATVRKSNPVEYQEDLDEVVSLLGPATEYNISLNSKVGKVQEELAAKYGIMLISDDMRGDMIDALSSGSE